MLENILFGIVAFVFFLVAHWVVFYYGKFRNHRFWILRGIWLVFGIVYTLMAWYGPRNFIREGIEETNTIGNVVSYLNGLLVYGFLFILYGYPYYIADRSITVRSLMEIEHSPQKQLTLDELQRKYDHATMLGMRLENLVYGGYLEKAGAAYRLTKKGALTARFFTLARRILHPPLGY